MQCGGIWRRSIARNATALLELLAAAVRAGFIPYPRQPLRRHHDGRADDNGRQIASCASNCSKETNCCSEKVNCDAERESSADGKKRSFLTVGWSGMLDRWRHVYIGEPLFVEQRMLSQN
jgi:hypothetical protein